MKTLLATGLAILSLAGAVAPAFAYGPNDRYNHYQGNGYRAGYGNGNGYGNQYGNTGNRSQIRQGIQNGDLSPDEAAKLRKQQRLVAEQRQRFMSDGRLSDSERRQLEQSQRLLQRNIRNEIRR